MTMPHLMNCPHMDDGWCLDCVKEEHDLAERETPGFFSDKHDTAFYAVASGRKSPHSGDPLYVIVCISPIYPTEVLPREVTWDTFWSKSWLEQPASQDDVNDALEICENLLLKYGDPFRGDHWQTMRLIRRALGKEPMDDQG